MTHARICGEILFEAAWPAAACTQTNGVEHSHSDRTVPQAIAAGIARPLAPGEVVFCADDHHDTLCIGTCSGCRADCSGVMFARESATVAEWEAAGAGYPKEWEGI